MYWNNAQEMLDTIWHDMIAVGCNNDMLMVLGQAGAYTLDTTYDT